MIYEAHNYQNYSTEFVINNPISALMIDMGLGKSVITLTAISELMFDYFKVSKVLVIAPLRVALNTWPNEIKKWDHLSYLSYSVVIGNKEQRIKALNTKADIYIINRENVQWLVENTKTQFDFDMVVIDELSSFKSYKAQRFKSLISVRHNIKRIVGLTGTPASNGLMDLWAQFRILDGGKRLGRFISKFRSDYFRPDKTNGQIVFSYAPLPFAEESIYKAIEDISISMKAVEHLNMPELITNEYKVRFGERELKIYKELKKELTLDFNDSELTIANAATLSNKLLQLANGALYSDTKEVEVIHDLKLDALEDLIEAQNGKPILVAYWYKHDLERIKNKLNKLGLVYGQLSDSENINRWNEGKLQVGLIHPASAGHGLNLQSGGSTLIWFSLIWSLELYQQTVARLYRQGQESKTVVVTHIVAEGTIDEQVIHALNKKDVTQSALIDALRANLEE